MPARADKPHTHGRTDCCVVGCERECTHGVCNHHRQLYKLHHWMKDERSPSICLAYLRARCHMRGYPDPCWDPDAPPINEKGYVWISFFGQKKVRAHRLAYRLQHIIDGGHWNDINPTVFVLHSALCEERFTKGIIKNKCWNPAHLRLGSEEENKVDQWRNQRENNPFFDPNKGCMVDGCEGQHSAMGFCKKHYHATYWSQNAKSKGAKRMEIYYRLKELGVCVNCAKAPASGGTVRCEPCNALQREYARISRQRLRRAA